MPLCRLNSSWNYSQFGHFYQTFLVLEQIQKNPLPRFVHLVILNCRNCWSDRVHRCKQATNPIATTFNSNQAFRKRGVHQWIFPVRQGNYKTNKHRHFFSIQIDIDREDCFWDNCHLWHRVEFTGYSIVFHSQFFEFLDSLTKSKDRKRNRTVV